MAKSSNQPTAGSACCRGWPCRVGLIVLLLLLLAGAWWLGRSGGRGESNPAGATSELSSEEARQLEAFLDHYFDSWSRQDMSAYEACFHPRATIHHVDPDGAVSMQRLGDFIAGQRAGHARSPERMVEVPLWHRVEPGLRAVQVHVRWHLTAGSREVLGRNHYTLLRDEAGGFKILNLVFYGEETTAAEG